jgi:acyl-CoA thioesterase-1
MTYGARRLRSKAGGLAISAAVALSPAPLLAEPVDILALGDSLTQGYGLPPGDGFVAQLGDWMARNGVEVRLVNGGVSGDTTAGGAARVGWSLTPDVDAMIVALGGNDLLRGLDPAASRANLDAILQEAQARGVAVLLVGMSAPGNYGPEYKAAFDAIYPDLAETYGALYFESFFKGLGSDDPAELTQYMQPDGIHPNAAGVALIVQALGPAVAELARVAGPG